MDKNKESLFIGYIDGTLDSSQIEELQSLIGMKEEAKQELLEMKEIADCAYDNEISPYEKERLVASLMNAVTGGRSVSQFRLREFFRYAAVAVVALFIGIAGTLGLKPSNIPEQMSVNITPGGTGTTILPDGTRVTLKSSSSLHYDASTFDGKSTRVVKLDGEAFFEVAPAGGREFVVETELETVHVTGTSFNLQAYDADATSTLVLLEGKVSLDLLDISGERVHSLELHPGERCTYEKRTGEVSVEKISKGDASLDWTSGTYYFRGESLQKIVSRLEQYYEVSIELGQGLDSIGGYSGALSINDGLDRVLSLLDYDNAFTVEKRENGYYLLKPSK